MDPISVERQGEMHGAEIIRRVPRSVDPLRDELLWGIPNDVTLDYIAPQLPRRTYEEVAKIGPHGQRALQGRMVYDAREEFLLVSCNFLTNIRYDDTPLLCIDKRTISLFSPSEERWYKIPPIPGCHEGVLHNNYLQAILDGSLYLVGGTRSRKVVDIPSAEVFVLDLARHPLEWRQCANMQVARLYFTVRVMHGKSFVFGGVTSSENFTYEVRNEVYDPTVDTWSFIAPTTPLVSIYHAFSVGQPGGQKFFACIGSIPIDTELDFCDHNIDTKFVVTVDHRGPKIRSTSDVDTEDDMDGLHEIIGKELADRPSVPFQQSPAQRLASLITHHQQHHRSFIGFYDPVTDLWRQFDMANLENANVDEYRPKHVFTLRQDDDGSDSDDDGSDLDDDEPEPGDNGPEPGDDGSDLDEDGPDPDDDVKAYVWSITL